MNVVRDATSVAGSQSYSRGWVPEKIQGKTAVREFVFTRSVSIGNLERVMETIITLMEEGQTHEPAALMDALCNTLGVQLKIRPDEVCMADATLADTLRKANLPFDGGVLRFSVNEISQWRAEDYARVIRILKERIGVLRDYTQQARNIRMYGNSKYYYIPRELFP
jgi:hypothetical protein